MPNTREQRYIQCAIKAAHCSSSKMRLGAALVKSKNILSTGFNQMNKTHPRQEQFNFNRETIGLHAEVHVCLGVARGDLIDSTLYLVRILKNNFLALSKPCNSCERFLYSVGVKKVVYTTGLDTVSYLELKNRYLK